MIEIYAMIYKFSSIRNHKADQVILYFNQSTLDAQKKSFIILMKTG
jgi:hypothetical protein